MQLSYPDISNIPACSPIVLKTLQCWLSVLQPLLYTRAIDGIYTNEIDRALASYKQTTSQQTWVALEQALKAKAPVVPAEFSKATFPTLSSRLNRIGIQYQAAEEVQAKQFGNAMLRRADQFIRHNQNTADVDLFPAMLNGNAAFTDRTWSNFENTWGIFWGAPWLGIAAEPLSGLNPNGSFWCSRELFELLRKWGQTYRSYLSAHGKQSADIEAHPIGVVFTGQRLGGPVHEFPGHSQIGLSAVLRGFDEQFISLQGISETLAAADPAWRIRMKGSGNSGFENILLSGSAAMPVLEMHPEWERLIYHTGTFPGLVAELGITENENKLNRFVRGIKEQLEWLSADDLVLVFDSIRKHAPNKFISFFGKLIESGMFTTILKRICEEEEAKVDFIGKLLGITEFPIIAEEWQGKIASLFMYQDKFEQVANELNADSFEKVLKDQLKEVIA